jgi:hypothetical protein
MITGLLLIQTLQNDMIKKVTTIKETSAELDDRTSVKISDLIALLNIKQSEGYTHLSVRIGTDWEGQLYDEVELTFSERRIESNEEYNARILKEQQVEQERLKQAQWERKRIYDMLKKEFGE